VLKFEGHIRRQDASALLQLDIQASSELANRCFLLKLIAGSAVADATVMRSVAKIMKSFMMHPHQTS
jgi:hypothetical protein